MCFTPLPRALCRHLNFKKCSEPGVFCTFDLEMCFALQRCALVHLSSPQMAPILHKKDEHLPSFGQVDGQEVVSVGGSEINANSFMFDSERNVPAEPQAGLKPEELAQMDAGRGLFGNFSSHLATWLCTRRFGETTFRPSGATNHWKHTVFRDFPAFSRTWIFLLLKHLKLSLL